MYYAHTSDDHTLEQLQQIIRDEESGASLFVECKAASVLEKGKKVRRNVLKFQELPPGQQPAEASLTAKPPADIDRIQWQGTLFVEGKLKGAYLSR